MFLQSMKSQMDSLIFKLLMWILVSSSVQASAAANSCKWTAQPILGMSMKSNRGKWWNARGTLTKRFPLHIHWERLSLHFWERRHFVAVLSYHNGPGQLELPMKRSHTWLSVRNKSLQWNYVLPKLSKGMRNRQELCWNLLELAALKVCPKLNLLHYVKQHVEVLWSLLWPKT